VTRRSDLAVKALRVLDDAPVRVKGPELARRLNSTPGFVPQVLGPLVRARWVKSDPGPTGGYRLIADLADISVLQVIEAIEGPTDTGQCVLVDRPCDEAGHCALHRPWTHARDVLLADLETVSVAEVCSDYFGLPDV